MINRNDAGRPTGLKTARRPPPPPRTEPQEGFGVESMAFSSESALRRAVIVHEDAGLRAKVRDILTSRMRVQVDEARNADALRYPVFFRNADTLLIGVSAVATFGRRLGQVLNDLRPAAKLILLLERSELVQALDIIHKCDGFVFSDMNLHRLVEVIDLAKNGYCILPPPLLTDLASQQIRLDLVRRLNQDELSVLALFGRGLSNREISRRMGLAESTVKNIVRSLLRKLHFRNRTEAAVFALWHSIPNRAWPDDETAEE